MSSLYLVLSGLFGDIEGIFYDHKVPLPEKQKRLLYILRYKLKQLLHYLQTRISGRDLPLNIIPLAGC